MPADAAQLKERLEAYRQMLGTLGMRDYQVKAVASLRHRFYRLDSTFLCTQWYEVHSEASHNATCNVFVFRFISDLNHKVRTLESPNPLRATYTVVHMFAVLILASVPSLILNLPVGVVARYDNHPCAILREFLRCYLFVLSQSRAI